MCKKLSMHLFLFIGGFFIVECTDTSSKSNFVEERASQITSPSTLFSEGVEQGKTVFSSFRLMAEATQGDSKNGTNYIGLDGLWQTTYGLKTDERHYFFYEKDYDTDDWRTIYLPDTTLVTPTLEHQGIALYKKSVQIPKQWVNQEVFIHLERVSASFYLWVNGFRVGYTKDGNHSSRLNVTPYIVRGENEISIEVHGSKEVEPRILHNIYLYTTPHNYISNYELTSHLTDNYTTANIMLKINLRSQQKTQVQNVLYEIRDKETIIQSDVQSVVTNGEERSVLFRGTIPYIQAWNAEQPKLYQLTISLLDEEKKISQVIQSSIGFREVAMREGKFTINGHSIFLKGVTLPSTTLNYSQNKELEKHIRMMKNHNINAIQVTNPPLFNYFYELCDKYGLYVVESNKLSDEFLRGISSDYLYSYLKRFSYGKKHHPSVILSMLSGSPDSTLEETIVELQRRDSSLLVQYNGDLSEGTVAPVWTVPYLSLQEITRYYLQRRNQKRPLIMTRYTESGGGLGQLADFWDAIKRYPIVQGGFIDSWLSTSSQGLVSSNNTAYASLAEVKKVYQDFVLQPVNLYTGLFEFENNSLFTTVKDMPLQWEIVADGQAIETGEVSLEEVPPSSSKRVKITYPKIDLQANTEYFLQLSVYKDTNTSPVVLNQFKLPLRKPLSLKVASLPFPSFSENEESIVVTGNNFNVTFNKHTGELSSWIHKGLERITRPLSTHFSRPPTTYDLALRKSENSEIWQEVRERDSVFLSKVNNGSRGVEVSFRSYLIASDNTTKLGQVLTKYTVESSGEILVTMTFYNYTATLTLPKKRTLFSLYDSTGKLPSLSRLGFSWSLPTSFENMYYFGRGGHNNYSDRNSSTLVGHYKKKVKEKRLVYISPSKHQNKTEVRWLAFYNMQGRGVLFLAENYYLQTSVVSTGGASPIIEVSLDHKQGGIGNIANDIVVEDPFRLRKSFYTYSFRAIPFEHPNYIISKSKRNKSIIELIKP